MSRIGLVAIGRNEGERLRRCLESIVNQVEQVVYVDSGSSDGSVELARSLGVSVVELDLSIPFTAARARNAGLEHLLALDANLDYVQFVDGDCEVVDGWIPAAQHTLDRQPEVVVVCGRRRERFPDASIYNRLCDIEWNTPVGEATACGGDALMRISALQTVGGYNPNLIAGEEPELCVRLRQNGGKILRIDAEMTLHDAQIMHFGQWWKRTLRAGHAYAEGAWLHGAPPERHWVREVKSIRLWGFIIPCLSLLAAWFTRGWSLILFLAYPVMIYRIAQWMKGTGLPSKDAWLYGSFCMIGKFPQAQGMLQFYWNRFLGQRSTLIEYNSVEANS